MKRALGLIIFIGISELAGVVGSVFTMPKIDGWYAALAKPALNPPAWVFGPVWTTLFLLMGVAAWLVWREHSNILENVGMSRVRRWGIGLFFLQLALNVLWSYLFFGARNPGAALVEIVVLWLAIAATIFVFAKLRKSAAWLLTPYLVWVSFAVYLNYSFWILNG